MMIEADGAGIAGTDDEMDAGGACLPQGIEKRLHQSAAEALALLPRQDIDMEMRGISGEEVVCGARGVMDQAGRPFVCVALSGRDVAGIAIALPQCRPPLPFKPLFEGGRVENPERESAGALAWSSATRANSGESGRA